jgi:two-component system OmpR family response regulator
VKLLVIEDDKELADYLCAELVRRGHVPTHALTLAAARACIESGGFDALILDRMLADGDGLKFLSEIRGQGLSVPVLVLSALGDVGHRVEGLNSGGDDYLVKPFAIAELVARLEALLRRANPGVSTTRLTVGDLAMDLIANRVWRAGIEVRLQPREFKLLEFLARHAGQVVTRTMLLEAVWGLKFDPQTNVVDVHISRLRQKIEDGFDVPLLHTVRGEGYRLVAVT